MEARDDSTWHDAPLRQSPLLVWGIGTVGRQFAGSLNDWIQAKAQAPALFTHFQPEPEEDLARSFGLALAPLIEAARKRGGLSSLEVKLIAATWETEGYPLHEALPVISQVLNQLLSGNQSITLSLIAPDALAPAESTVRSRLCLEQLEALFGELPFLNAAFLYQTPPHADEGMNDTSQSCLTELLLRECFDAELGEAIRQTVFPVMSMNRQFNGRKAVYAALGAQTLSYSPDELGGHWSARFTRDVIFGGFNSAKAVSETVAVQCDRRANQWADACLPLLEQCLSHKPSQNSRPAWPPTLADNAALRTFGNGLLQLIEEAKETEAHKHQDTLAQAATLLEAGLGAELDSHPAYLAGGLAFLEAVAGHPARTVIAEDETPPPTGILRITERFVGQPLAEAAATCFNPLQQSLLAEYAKLEPVPEGLPDAIIGSVVKAVPANGEALVNVWKGRFHIVSQDLVSAYVERNRLDASSAGQLFHSLWDSFSHICGGLLDTIAENLAQQGQTRQAILDLRNAAPWYLKPVYPLSHYQTEENTLKRQLQALTGQATKLEGFLAALLATCQGIIEQLWWPHWRRTLLVDGLQPVWQKQKQQLDDYIVALQQASLALWEEHESITVRDTLLETSLPTTGQDDTLYTRTAQDMDWGEHARRILAHAPNANPQPAYARFASLNEHFHAPSKRLIERIHDYALKLFDPLISLSLLGMIEIDGPADAFFHRVSDKLQSYPEFSTGLLPTATNQDCLKRLLVIRCDAPTQARLLSQYPHRFGLENRFIVVEDPLRIDITLVTFGFSASLLHVFGEFGESHEQ